MLRTSIRRLAVASIVALVASAAVIGPLAPSQAAGPDRCTTQSGSSSTRNCSLDQTVTLTILPPGSTPPKAEPTRQGTKATDSPKRLARTGPPDTALLALAALAILQLGAILVVGAGGPARRRRIAT